LTEGIIAPGEAAAPTAATLRWTFRGLWSRGALLGLIGTSTGVLLATEVELRMVSFVGLTATITTIWFLALRKTPSSARGRRLESVIGTAIGTATGLAAVSLLNFWVLEVLISPSTLLVMAGNVLLLAATFEAMAVRGLAPRRVALVGADDDALELIRGLHAGRNQEFQCIGVVADRLDGIELADVPFLGRSDDLIEILRRERPELIVCSSVSLQTRIVDSLLDAGLTSIRVVDSLEFHEHAFRRVASRQMPPSWFASVVDMHHRHYSARSKRVFDVTAASLALLVLLPFFVLIPLLVRLSGPGPVLIRQVRSGEAGELFEMLKFRSMVQNAEAGRPIWATQDDPRVTRVGRFLRKTRLDELPQLWNVLRGEMSMVGPRPERPEFLDVLGKEVPFWSRRHLLKPGMTGWAQIHFTPTADISGAARKLSYDLYYLKHRSLALDLVILLKTLKVVVFGPSRSDTD
jgi:exopolysaccharide biosynthesis polyprenyl glycosylphosphotransferase